VTVNAAGVLEDIRGVVEGLLDAANPDHGYYARLELLLRAVDQAHEMVPRCSLCEAGHVALQPCMPVAVSPAVPRREAEDAEDRIREDQTQRIVDWLRGREGYGPIWFGNAADVRAGIADHFGAEL